VRQEGLDRSITHTQREEHAEVCGLGSHVVQVENYSTNRGTGKSVCKLSSQNSEMANLERLILKVS
jgi:transketolase C-terminal domain/subunit